MKRIFTVTLALLLLTAGMTMAGSGGYGSGANCPNPHRTGKLATATFEAMDSDKSGAISFEEFKAVFPRVSQEGFARLDTGGDGELSKEEWQAFKDAHRGMGGGRPPSP